MINGFNVHIQLLFAWHFISVFKQNCRRELIPKIVDESTSQHLFQSGGKSLHINLIFNIFDLWT